MATINISEDVLPAINEWEEGETYKIELQVKQATPSNEGEAQFEVQKAMGRDTTIDEEVEQEKDEGDPKSLLDFQESKEKARKEVVEPSQGNEGAGTEAPERRTV